ncbi:MAG: PilC/PilY family type IV pilus protein, partial [Caldimicrobium sp.]
GREEWAFIPMNAIPYLIWYGHKDYCHIPVVDYRTYIVDASIGGPSDGVKTSQSWRTLLIGVMGFGGKELAGYSSSIFVLDLTDWLNGASNSPTLLWEKALTDKTLTLSFPAVVRLGDPQKNGEWYLVVGSGPKDPYGSTFSSTPKIYFFDLRNGDLVKEISLPGGFAVGDLYTVDYDNDYRDDVIYFGTYNLTSGNLYRLTLRNPDGSYKSVSDLTANDISLAFSVNRPIFAAPIVSLDKAQNFWIFFGTGRFLREEDKTFGYNNYLVGFKDDCIKGTCSITYNLNSQGMEDRTGSLTNIVVTRTEQICSCSWDGCTLKEVAVDGIYTGTPASIPARGWYHRLENTNDYKELIYSQPFVFGGNIDALVFSVSSDICKIGGETILMALCYETGVPCAKPSALILQANIGQTLALPSKFSLGPGAPPFGQPFQVSALEKTGTGKYEKVLQTSFGVIMKLSQVEQEASKGKFILWIEK